MNKFLRADNLDKLAKNTSFFAIMAVGATFVIITGGIDLSVGSIYCLAAVCGAMFLNHFGPQAPGRALRPFGWCRRAILLCLGAGTCADCSMGWAWSGLRVHPFVITSGTMAIYRGVAFVMTKAQAFTHFPAQFTDGLIRHEIDWHGAESLSRAAGHHDRRDGPGRWYLKHAVTGRQIFAVGGNEQASLFSGLPVSASK